MKGGIHQGRNGWAMEGGIHPIPDGKDGTMKEGVHFFIVVVEALFVIIEDFVEEDVEGSHGAEHLFDAVLAVGLAHEAVGDGVPHRVETRPQVLGEWEVLWETLGCRLHRVFAHDGEELMKIGSLDNRAETVEIVDNRLADALEQRCRRAP